MDEPPLLPGLNDRMGSVRSILREPNTPGTGQNVRFFSRDAYKVISPEISMDDMYAPPPPPKDTTPSFMDSLRQSGPESTSTPAVRHGRSHSKSSRPSVSDLFSPLNEPSPLPGTPLKEAASSDMSFASPPVANGSPNLFDVSQPLDLRFSSGGLGFDVHAPIFDQSMDMDSSFHHSTNSENGHGFSGNAKLFSTPPRPKTEPQQEEHLQVPAPQATGVDETIFHAKDVPPRMPTPLHDRSQSYAGQTVFFSMGTENTHASTSNNSAAYPSSDLKESSLSMDSPASSRSSVPSSTKSNRTRAISDSMLQNMLRVGSGSPKPRAAPPEADINDERGEQVLVYAPPPVPEPDPFSAHASTYYTPQVMIPTTPPKSAISHTRKTSKEENLIYSLQTQLALQTELCQQYEADLRARDELVELLGSKLKDAEKVENQRKTALRGWKKKVQELEKACRYLEEEVDSSRQMSMERSVMDEASGEALRMLHRQIAALERERGEQMKREHMMKEEIETLETLVKERSEDVMHLKETLWNRDESERELSQGIREVKAQVDEMGNVSMAYIDEEELRRLREEKEQATEAEKNRHRVIELQWQQEKEELIVKLEGVQAEKTSWEEDLEKARQQLKARDEEYDTLRAELEAQWSHTEQMSSKIEELEKEKIRVEQERDELKLHVEDLESRINGMEVEWNESENKKAEIENEIQELWNLREALEKDRDQIDYDLQQEQERAEGLAATVQEHEGRISQLEQELQFANESNTRLQEGNRKRDGEVEDYRNRVVRSENESEGLREELATLKREYMRLLDEQERRSRESTSHDSEIKANLEKIIKQKAESDVELKTYRDQVSALKDEVERLRRHVHTLQQESADKEVKIVHLEKQKSVAEQDMMGLNIALDSKQQELELMKRQMGVRGTAGMTPAQPSKSNRNRRDSAVFSSTPLSQAILSDNEGTVKKPHERKQSIDRPPSSASASRPSTALAKSSRVNSSVSRVGSMGPPPNPVKPRPSAGSSVGTPTPTAKGLGRSNSASAVVPAPEPNRLVSPTGTPLPKKRVSNAISALEQRVAASAASSSSRPAVGKLSKITSPVPKVVELDEKENVGESASTPRRRVPVAAT
ncbi:hypothetical protein EST38_g5713 [Candolleomyces aberdarensis]|uniref:Uncharacterized protein n=1 Tax=Candolleomyces aberdarensis TaxID=2316362 RepID=A0A4Q2DJR9_9AGAR|nr:hypothetical protein EST38_g5713 [Candolleomyces aberdarensis]